MSTKVFFASADELGKSVPPLNRQAVRYRLASYYYMRNRNEKRMEDTLYNTNPSDPVFFVDSGAFTAMTSMEKQLTGHPEKFWSWADEYCDNYCKFLEKHKGRLFCAAELDFDNLLVHDDIYAETPEKWATSIHEWWKGEGDYKSRIPPPVMEWRRRLMQTGVLIIPVWHEVRELKGWAEDCKNFKYLGFTSTASKDIARVFKYFVEAKNTGTMIHGLGLTKPDFIRKFPWYSVDSTTWLDGSKYGTTIIFQNGRLRYFDAKRSAIRKKFRHTYRSWGLDTDKIEQGDAYAMDEANLVSWLHYAEFVAKNSAKDYWEKEPNGSPKDSLGPVRGKSAAGTPEPQEEPVDFKPSNYVNGVDAEEVEEAEEYVEEEEHVKQKNPLRDSIPNPTSSAAKLVCNSCVIGERCQFFEEDAACHYKFQGDFTSPTGIVQVYTDLIRIQHERVQFSRIQEQADGGQLDQRLSTEIKSLENMMHGLKDLLMPTAPQDSLEVKASGGAVSAILSQLLPKPRKKTNETRVSEPLQIEG